MNRPSAILLFAFVIAAGALLSTNAFGYQFISGSQCPGGASWGASNQPLPYYINENGSADVSFSQVQTIVQDSFDEWSEPCCSSFSATYAGTTSRTALNTNSVVLSWEENNWPAQIGDVRQVIAVTLSSVYNNCEIASAPILFNGVGFQFCTSGHYCTDLQAIATHEIGHNLGLGHTNVSGATMYPAYQGGTGARSLAQDDVNGVCALYPATCSCTRDSDCRSNKVCNAGQCEDAPCQGDFDCPSGRECNLSTGDCQIPSCASDADCADGYSCNSQGQCESICPVCRPCSTHNDCGANGVCADVGGGQGRCITPCGSGGSCPGDSQCYAYDDYYICLNPEADTSGICPSSYTCGGGSSDAPSDDDTDPCDDVTCPGGEICEDGQCVDDGSSNDDAQGAGDVGGSCLDCDGADAGSGADSGPHGTDDNDDSDDSDDNSDDGSDGPVRTSEGASSGEESACSVSAPGSAAPTSLMLLAAFGLGALWRRRRQQR